MSRLSRRIPLRRYAPLVRSGLPRAASLRRRAPLRPVSNRRASAREDRDEVRAFVFRRDGGCRLATWGHGGGTGPAPCLGELSFHHIRKSSQGGPYTRLNGLAVCVGHNDWLETFEGRRWGVTRGVVCPRDRSLEDCWALMRRFGLVRWDHDGLA